MCYPSSCRSLLSKVERQANWALPQLFVFLFCWGGMGGKIGFHIILKMFYRFQSLSEASSR